MSAAPETQREILENRQIAYTAHAEIAHAHIRSQVAQGCRTDGTSHAHRIIIQIPKPTTCRWSCGVHGRVRFKTSSRSVSKVIQTSLTKPLVVVSMGQSVCTNACTPPSASPVMHPLVDLFAFGARIVHAVVAHLGVHAAVGIPVWPLELLGPPLEPFFALWNFLLRRWSAKCS